MFSDAESNKQLKVLTNNFTPPALTIPQMYKQRRQVDTYERCALRRHRRLLLHAQCGGWSTI